MRSSIHPSYPPSNRFIHRSIHLYSHSYIQYSNYPLILPLIQPPDLVSVLLLSNTRSRSHSGSSRSSTVHYCSCCCSPLVRLPPSVRPSVHPSVYVSEGFWERDSGAACASDGERRCCQEELRRPENNRQSTNDSSICIQEAETTPPFTPIPPHHRHSHPYCSNGEERVFVQIK